MGEGEHQTTLGHYVVLDVLGTGGMGVVYKAYDPRLDRAVALKLLHARKTDGEATLAGRDRLLREAQALARVSHPNVIAIYDVGLIDNQVFVAMELVVGRTLRAFVENDKPSPRAIVLAYVAAGEGLLAVHRAGLVHRDFKPDNVLVGDDGRVRLLDFGLVRSLQRGKSDPPPDGGDVDVDVLRTAPGLLLLETALTRAGRIVGTPRYMAPEMYGGVVDARTDQFAFAVALYEALCGTHPFGVATRADYRRLIARGEVRDPPAGRRVHKSVWRVLVRALRASPNERYPSMAELLDELRKDPLAGRRRAFVMLAAVVGMTLVALIIRRSFVRTSMLCAGGDARLAEAWSGPRKDAVRTAFLATGKPYAGLAFEGVTNLLDARGQAWVQARREACEATRLRGEQSEELLDLRMQCLDTHLAELRATVDAFVVADDGVVQHAIEAAQHLTHLDACSDVTSLRRAVRPPADPAVRARIDDVRQRLEEVRALLHAFKIEAGLAKVTPLLEAARSMDYRPLVAEVALLYGRLQEAHGDYTAAAASYRESIRAGEAGRVDEVGADAATELVWVVTEGAGKYEEALELSLDARAKMERLEHGEAQEGRLLGVIADILFRTGRYDESLATSRRAIAIDARREGPESEVVLEHYNTMGNALHGQGKYEEARETYERVLQVRARVLGPSHPLVAAMLVNVANALSKLGRHEEAVGTLRRSLAIMEAELGPDNPELGYVLTSLGVELHEEEDTAGAIAAHQRAIALWEKAMGPEHAGVGVARYNLGDTLMTDERYVEAEVQFRAALAIEEKASGPEHPYTGMAHYGVGTALAKQGKYKEAIVHLTRAIAISDKGGAAEHPEGALAAAALGEVYVETGRVAEGRARLEHAIHEGEVNGDGAVELAPVRFAYAQALAKSGDREGARAEAGRALAGFASKAHHERRAAAVQAWLDGLGAPRPAKPH